MRFFGDGRTADHAAAWGAIAGSLGHWALRGFGFFAIEEKATGRFIGWSGLLSPAGWPGIEIAWGIAPRAWGRGFATEDDAFTRLRLQRLVSIIHPVATSAGVVEQRATAVAQQPRKPAPCGVAAVPTPVAKAAPTTPPRSASRSSSASTSNARSNSTAARCTCTPSRRSRHHAREPPIDGASERVYPLSHCGRGRGPSRSDGRVRGRGRGNSRSN